MTSITQAMMIHRSTLRQKMRPRLEEVQSTCRIRLTTTSTDRKTFRTVFHGLSRLISGSVPTQGHCSHEQSRSDDLMVHPIRTSSRSAA